MSSPKGGDEKLLKRTIRYLRRYPISERMFVWQARPKKATLNIDSDWAGDQKSRKSTIGGTIRHGHHLIQHWSKLQATIALSSGEAELNSAVKGTSELIGFKEMLTDFNQELKMELITDASVCKSILLRQGCGKIKHLSTKQLWVQGAIETYGISIIKVPRAENPSDLLTHGCNKVDHFKHLRALSQNVFSNQDANAEGGC